MLLLLLLVAVFAEPTIRFTENMSAKILGDGSLLTHFQFETIWDIASQEDGIPASDHSNRFSYVPPSHRHNCTEVSSGRIPSRLHTGTMG